MVYTLLAPNEPTDPEVSWCAQLAGVDFADESTAQTSPLTKAWHKGRKRLASSKAVSSSARMQETQRPQLVVEGVKTTRGRTANARRKELLFADAVGEAHVVLRSEDAVGAGEALTSPLQGRRRAGEAATLTMLTNAVSATDRARRHVLEGIRHRRGLRATEQDVGAATTQFVALSGSDSSQTVVRVDGALADGAVDSVVTTLVDGRKFTCVTFADGERRLYEQDAVHAHTDASDRSGDWAYASALGSAGERLVCVEYADGERLFYGGEGEDLQVTRIERPARPTRLSAADGDQRDCSEGQAPSAAVVPSDSTTHFMVCAAESIEQPPGAGSAAESPHLPSTSSFFLGARGRERLVRAQRADGSTLWYRGAEGDYRLVRADLAPEAGGAGDGASHFYEGRCGAERLVRVEQPMSPVQYYAGVRGSERMVRAQWPDGAKVVWSGRRPHGTRVCLDSAASAAAAATPSDVAPTPSTPLQSPPVRAGYSLRGSSVASALDSARRQVKLLGGTSSMPTLSPTAANNLSPSWSRQ